MHFSHLENNEKHVKTFVVTMTAQLTGAFKAVAPILTFKTYKNNCRGLLQIGVLGRGDGSGSGMVEIG